MSYRISVTLDVARNYDLDKIERFVNLMPNEKFTTVQVSLCLEDKRNDGRISMPTVLWCQWLNGESNYGSHYLDPETMRPYCRDCQGKGEHHYAGQHTSLQCKTCKGKPLFGVEDIDWLLTHKEVHYRAMGAYLQEFRDEL